ncbi:protein phosphatase 2C domain-containing protein [Streptomyces sp. NPDC005374]|uniref:protein phosphatase 2C domain-containing protein n=1 Tax=Streptomyces sp. NPDC005374 TaxID=3364713 RepID=UPI0036843AA5
MSQQGGNPTGHEDDWWGQLYDSTDDTGPTPAPDSLDDRFASAAGAVTDGSGTARGTGVPGGPGSGSAAGAGGTADEPDRRPGTGVPAPRSGFPEASDAPPRASSGRHRAPWEPPDTREDPVPFPPGPKPPGFVARGPEDRPAPPRGDRTSMAPSAPPTPPHPAAPPPPTAPPRPSQDTENPENPEHPPSSSRRAGSDKRRREDDWWAVAPPAPDPTRKPPGAAAPTGPGSTQPNPTAEPAGPGRPTEPGTKASPQRREDVEAADPRPAPEPAAAPAPRTLRTATRVDLPTLPPVPVGFVGSGPPTYDAEPTALPPADPDELDDLVADTVLDGARYGACTLRAVSVRGDSARFRGEPRRDSLLTARFGTGDQALILVAMATGARATPGAHRAAAEACHWIGRAVGRSHARLAQDIGEARRGDLKSGLHRLTDRSLGKLRASAAEQGVDPEEYAATLRCLLLPADPECRVRVFFGVGAGGLFRLRDGEWHDIEPRITDVTGEPVVGFGSLPAETPEGDRLTMDLGIPTPPSPYEPAPEPHREPFRFRASVARPGDTLLMCTGGLAEPLRGEPELCEYLTGRWSGPTAPGLAEFLADSQVRAKGYADDRTAAAVWEA